MSVLGAAVLGTSVRVRLEFRSYEVMELPVNAAARLDSQGHGSLVQSTA